MPKKAGKTFLKPTFENAIDNKMKIITILVLITKEQSIDNEMN
jgi:hypothetical protein